MSAEAPISTISAPTISPEVGVPQSFSPTIRPNEAGFNFNPSLGNAVDLKIETYTRPLEAEPHYNLPTLENFSYPQYDLDISAISAIPHHLFALPEYKYQAEQIVSELSMPADLAEKTLDNDNQTLREVDIDAIAINRTISQLSNLQLTAQEQDTWTQKFQDLIREKTQKDDEPADFAPVIKIENPHVGPQSATQSEPVQLNSFGLVNFDTQSATQPTETINTTPDSEVPTAPVTVQTRVETAPEVLTATAPAKITTETTQQTAAQVDPVSTAEEQVTATTQTLGEESAQTQPDDLLPTDLNPIIPEEAEAELLLEPHEQQIIEVPDSDETWDLFEVRKTRQVRKETLEYRLEAAAGIGEAAADLEDPHKVIAGQIYEIDVPTLKDQADILSGVLEFPLLKGKATSAGTKTETAAEEQEAIQQVIENEPPMETVVEVNYKGRIKRPANVDKAPEGFRKLNLGQGLTVEQKIAALKTIHAKEAA